MGKNRVTEVEKPGQHIGCGNNHFGCGKSMRIIRYHNDVEMVEAEGYNPAVHLCVACSNNVARDWMCDFNHLSFLMTAIQFCKAGACGATPTKTDIWAAMERMGIARADRHIGVQSFTEFKPMQDSEAEIKTAKDMLSTAIKIYQ